MAIRLQQNEMRKYFSALKRRYKLLLAVTFVVFFCTVLLAIYLPAVYESSAVILIERQEIPSDLVRSTVTSFADQRIQVISQRVMTSENLVEIINKYQLYENLRSKEPLEVVVELMRTAVIMEMISADVVDPRSGRPTQATIAFSIAFEHRSPSVAQRVTNELVSLYLNENLKNRTEAALESSSFLADEADRLREQVGAMEQRLATFKEANVDQLPELSDFNRRILDRTENELLEANRNIASLQERKIYLQSQLANTNPYSMVIGESGQRIASPQDRLKELSTEILSLKSRYGDNHPDVARMQKEIDIMRASNASRGGSKDLYLAIKDSEMRLASLQQKYSDAHPDVVNAKRELANVRAEFAQSTPLESRYGPNQQEADNPAYIQIKAQLEATNTELDSFIDKRSELERKLSDIERRISQTPNVEREYRALLRDYENSAAKYQEVAAKQMEAELSQKLESERKGEKFTLIEPPQLPEQPSKPNRFAIVILGMFLSLTAGFGSVATAQAMDNRIHGRQGVQELLGVPPIGVIPTIVIDGQKARTVQTTLFTSALVIVAIAVLLTIIHTQYKPLDVVWFVLLRKIGF